MDPYFRNDTYESRLGRANWDRPYTQAPPSQPLVSEDEIDALLDELSTAPDRETFNLVMSRFDANFISRFKARYPPTSGLFPHGSGTRQAPAPATVQQPFSYLGSLYQGTPRPQTIPSPMPDAFSQSRPSDYFAQTKGFDAAPTQYSRGRTGPYYSPSAPSFIPPPSNYPPSGSYDPANYYQPTNTSHYTHRSPGPNYGSMTQQSQYTGYGDPLQATWQSQGAPKLPYSSSPTPQSGRDLHPRKFAPENLHSRAPENLQSRDYLRESKELRQMKEDMLKQFSLPSVGQTASSQPTRPLY